MDRIDVKLRAKTPVHKGITNKFVFTQDDNKEYFFKENEKTKVDLGNDVAEVLSTYFFKKVGFNNFVEYKLAMNGEQSRGVISESFITKNVKYEKNFAELMTLYLYKQKYGKKYSLKNNFTESQMAQVERGMDDIIDGENYNSIEFVIDILQRVCDSEGVVFNVYAIKKDLLKMSILDFYMSDSDRHTFNLDFLFKQRRDGKIVCEFAPLFDHGCAFGVRSYWDDIAKETLPSVKSYFYPAIGISKFSQVNKAPDESGLECGGLFVRELMQEVKKDEELTTLFNACRNVDIQTCINEFNANEPVIIRESLAEHIVETFNKRLKMVEVQEKLLKNNSENKNISYSKERGIV